MLPHFQRVWLVPSLRSVDPRVAEGIRTPDHRDHNPGLYQLSYRHREIAPRIAVASGYFFAITTVAQLSLLLFPEWSKAWTQCASEPESLAGARQRM